MARYNELDNVKINSKCNSAKLQFNESVELYNLLHEWEAKYKRVDANSAFTTICNSFPTI